MEDINYKIGIINANEKQKSKKHDILTKYIYFLCTTPRSSTLYYYCH